jgi:hypothetical protein
VEGAHGAHGVAGATAFATPALAAPIYFNRQVVPDPAQLRSSVDSGVIWPRVPTGVYCHHRQVPRSPEHHRASTKSLSADSLRCVNAVEYETSAARAGRRPGCGPIGNWAWLRSGLIWPMRTRAATILIMTLAVAAAGCASGGDEETIGPEDLAENGRFYNELDPAEARRLAGLCLRSEQAARTGTPAGRQLQTLSAEDLAFALKTFYAGEHARVRISDACARLALKAVTKVELTVDIPGDRFVGFGTTTRSSHYLLRGTVEREGATVSVAEANRNTSGADASGWAEERDAAVRNGRWRLRVPVRNRGDDNSYRITAQSDTHRRAHLYVGIVRRLPIEQERATGERRAALREERRQAGVAETTRSFSGNGRQNLGTVRVPKELTLYWTCDGGVFQILADGGLFVNSHRSTGTSAVAAGTYHNVVVNAVCNWTIRIKPD